MRVLALLVWPRDRALVVPAELVKWTHDRVLVEWRSSPAARTSRRTWLPRGDVEGVADRALNCLFGVSPNRTADKTPAQGANC